MASDAMFGGKSAGQILEEGEAAGMSSESAQMLLVVAAKAQCAVAMMDTWPAVKYLLPDAIDADEALQQVKTVLTDGVTLETASGLITLTMLLRQMVRAQQTTLRFLVEKTGMSAEQIAEELSTRIAEDDDDA